MKRLTILCLLLLFGSVMYANADWIYSYETHKCIHQFGFFEYSKLKIYNVPPEKISSDYKALGELSSVCELEGGVKIQINKGNIKITKNGENIISGKNNFDIVRVFADKDSIDTIELCLVPSDMGEMFDGSVTGGCVYRGFPAIVEDGPHNAKQLKLLLRKGDK